MLPGDTGKGVHYTVFITQKCAQYKTSRTLKISIFKIPDNKNIGKLFSKYELLFLDQANYSSDPSQILILKFPIRRASVPPSTSLSNFYLSQLKRSLRKFSLCSSLVSLFCSIPFNHKPPQVLDIPNHMQSQSQSNFLSRYIQMIIHYGSNPIPSKS